MPKKVRYELDFSIDDRVIMITDEDEQMPGIVTEIHLSKTEVKYKVARGFEEKECYASELKLAEP